MIDKILKYMAPSTAATGILQLSLPLGIYLGIQSGAEWYWWAIAVFFYTIVYSMIGNNIALHRYFTHAHFKVSKPVEYFFLWTGSMIGLGGPLSYAMTHVIHHKHSDTKLDPHGPQRGKRSWLIWFQKTVDPKETPVFSKPIARLGRKYALLHKFYIPFLLINAGILWLIDYKLFLFVWLIPASAACWGIGWAVWRQHWHLEANNSPLHRWDYLYEGLHLNHHLHPGAPDTAVNPGEIDWTYQTSKLFKPEYNWQGQPNRDQTSD
jgi:fatty-acid desaturase|tara:strand:+ start:513 stop:1307 length:795 start_codon:yes stop_codon:yes gene_type:complete